MRLTTRSLKLIAEMVGDDEIWTVLTALRGPDIHELRTSYNAKKLTTAVVRWLVIEGDSVHPLNFNADVCSPAKAMEFYESLDSDERELTREFLVSNHHFRYHVMDALRILDLRYYRWVMATVMESEVL